MEGKLGKPCYVFCIWGASRTWTPCMQNILHLGYVQLLTPWTLTGYEMQPIFANNLWDLVLQDVATWLIGLRCMSSQTRQYTSYTNKYTLSMFAPWSRKSTPFPLITCLPAGNHPQQQGHSLGFPLSFLPSSAFLASSLSFVSSSSYA